MSRIRLATLIAVPLLAIGGALVYAHSPDAHHGSNEHRTEMHLDHMNAMLTKIGATDAQRSQVQGILKGGFAELDNAHKSHDSVLARAHDLLLAPSVDRMALESIRAEQIRACDEASKRMLSAFEDAAEVLSPEQRAALATEVRKHHGG